MAIESINPATGETIKTFEELTAQEIEAKLDKAERAYRDHRRTSFEQRARWMNKAADLLEKAKDDYARMMTLEMGKPLKAAGAEVEKCAWVCRYYAENAESFLSDEHLPSSAEESFVRYLPIGPVLAVMPWNFPLWQVFRFAAPALMAGNVGLLKHASNVPQCAIAIEDVFRRAGFADGCFQSLLIGSSKVNAVLEDDRVMAATLTGSEGAGAKVAAKCGEELKKTVLELGGSDPFVVMPSADVDRSIDVAVTARTINNGQSCIAAKRFIVHADIFDEWIARFTDGMASLTVGDPMRPETDIGPLATADIRDEVAGQVAKSIEMGAKVLTGGGPLDGPGNYFAPTVLTDIPKESPAYREEIFGPVAMVFKVSSVDEAIALANDSRFGLGSSVWTTDPEEMNRFADEIEAGQTFINQMVASDPRLPFGGVKKSGYGRELGPHGIREFVNAKTVYVAS